MSQEILSEPLTTAESSAPPTARRVGIWTPIVLTVLCVSALLLPNRLMEGSFIGLMIMFYGPMLCTLLFLIWWLFFSRTTWTEKLVALGGVIAVSVAAAMLSHETMVVALLMYLPTLMLVFWTLAFMAFRGRPSARKVAIPLSLVPAALICMSLRFEGVTGEFNPEFSLRWSKKPEEEYLASRDTTKTTRAELASAKALELSPGDWPAFRGPNRDGVLRGAKIRTDWKQNPPKELWRSKIGPAWSSMTVVGDRVFTQEQRGPHEAVVCLNLNDGKEVWSHVDETRFEEPVGGPGPRATPTFDSGRLYTFGAKGVLNAFDAATGKKLWSHDLGIEQKDDLKAELKMDLPMWGFASSPLVFGNLVAVFTGAKDKGVSVYNAVDGKRVWTSGTGGHSYVSVHLAKLSDVPMFLNTTNKGVEGLDPATGKQLWNHAWDVGDVVRCVQPALLSDSRIAIGTAFGFGTQVFSVEKAGKEFAAKSIDTVTSFKPYFSDFVMVGDAAFGFDGAIFGCYDLKAGKKLWRGGRYGSGQVLLIADQNLLLVVTETDGNVVLLPADKSAHKELAKFKALSGKTWNHPTIAHGKLLVRNAEEIACFDVSEK